GTQAKHGTVVEEYVELLAHSVRQRVRVVDSHLKHGARHIKLLARKRSLGAVLLLLHQRVCDRQAGVVTKTGRAANRQNRPACIHKLAQLRNGSCDRDVADPVAKFGRYALRINRPADTSATTAAASSASRASRG